ncbi:Nuclear nucleic acid-binding protein [Schistosoma japonicum]|uniref:Nuclear nucleic acid-binding protein C1D n=2 Tax=Schistosoma japonicum TaxID=6182 RepID=Q86F82_SCHJA|nr:similar to GenBank Accession Number BC016284 nuclear DNA-binding protein in Homo sapiens [Schistosoma japonicum]KAH8859767.1 nuclear nucleic acid binding protein C1D [Schistosoma japonicum]KAH8859770.1 nuclear nucleic acid binding protein C1D [Schistosoma japonicum]TNN13391.1 Nuclear nucleic acid-binding protein [Schistosoma japonicum]TNN13392.1 Nuclear nucleic acid-binding protein [Schistosoma japonicum]
MGDSSIFDEIPKEISSQLVSFSEATDDVEQLVNKISSFSNNSSNEVSGLDTVKSELSLCYAFNALFFMYLRCNGVETQSHPIMQELDRVMNALKRCRSLVEREVSARLTLDKEATTRFVKHALWKSAHTKTKKRRLDGSHS